MTNNIHKQLLQELIQQDPSLQEHESAILEVLRDIGAIQQSIDDIDKQKFIAALRPKVLSALEEKNNVTTQKQHWYKQWLVAPSFLQVATASMVVGLIFTSFLFSDINKVHDIDLIGLQSPSQFLLSPTNKHNSRSERQITESHDTFGLDSNSISAGFKYDSVYGAAEPIRIRLRDVKLLVFIISSVLFGILYAVVVLILRRAFSKQINKR